MAAQIFVGDLKLVGGHFAQASCEEIRSKFGGRDATVGKKLLPKGAMHLDRIAFTVLADRFGLPQATHVSKLQGEFLGELKFVGNHMAKIECKETMQKFERDVTVDRSSIPQQALHGDRVSFKVMTDRFGLPQAVAPCRLESPPASPVAKPAVKQPRPAAPQSKTGNMPAQIFVGDLKLVGGHFAQASCEEVRAKFDGRDATVDKKLLPKDAMHLDRIAFNVLADRFGLPQATHISKLQGEFLGELKFVGNHMAKIECKETMQKFERDVTIDRSSVPKQALHGDRVSFKVMTDRFGLPQAVEPRRLESRPPSAAAKPAVAIPVATTQPSPRAAPSRATVNMGCMAAQIFVGDLKLVGGHFAQASCEEVRAKFDGRDATVDKKLLPKDAMHLDRIAFTVLADRFGLPQATHISKLQGEFLGELKFVGNHMAKIECKETMQKFERDVTIDRSSVPKQALHGDRVSFKVMTDRFGLPQAVEPRRLESRPPSAAAKPAVAKPVATPQPSPRAAPSRATVCMAAQIFVGDLKLVGGHFAQASCEEVRAKFGGRDATVDKKLLPKDAMHLDRVAFTVLADRFGLPQATHVSKLQGEFLGELKFVGNHMAKIECKETMQKFERDVTLDRSSVPKQAVHGDRVSFKVMTDRFGLPQAVEPRRLESRPPLSVATPAAAASAALTQTKTVNKPAAAKPSRAAPPPSKAVSVGSVAAQIFVGDLKLVGGHFAQASCEEVRAKFGGRDATVDKKLLPRGAMHLDRIAFTVLADRFGLPQATHVSKLQGEFFGELKFVGNHMAKIECKETMQKFERDVTIDRSSVPEQALHGDRMSFKVMTDRFGLPQAVEARRLAPRPASAVATVAAKPAAAIKPRATEPTRFGLPELLAAIAAFVAFVTGRSRAQRSLSALALAALAVRMVARKSLADGRP